MPRYKSLKEKPELSPRRQRLFEIFRAQTNQRQHYLTQLKVCNWDSIKALRAAGYKESNLTTALSKINNDPNIQEYMRLLQDEMLDSLIEDKANTVNEIKYLAFSNIKDYIDPKTKAFKELDALTREQCAAIAELLFDKDTGKPTKLKLYDKRLSLQLLAQIQKLLSVEDSEDINDQQIMDKIRKAQDRIKPPAHMQDNAGKTIKLKKTG